MNKLKPIKERCMSVSEFASNLWDNLDDIQSRQPLRLPRGAGHHSVVIMTEEMYLNMVQANHMMEVDLGWIEDEGTVEAPTRAETMKAVKKRASTTFTYLDQDMAAGYYTTDEVERLNKFRELLDEDEEIDPIP